MPSKVGWNSFRKLGKSFLIGYMLKMEKVNFIRKGHEFLVLYQKKKEKTHSFLVKQWIEKRVKIKNIQFWRFLRDIFISKVVKRVGKSFLVGWNSLENLDKYLPLHQRTISLQGWKKFPPLRGQLTQPPRKN